MGISWCNTQAVWRGLTRWGGTFARTPKFRIEDHADDWADSGYRLKIDTSTIGEIVLACYGIIAIAIALLTLHTDLIPFLLLNTAAFATVAGIDVAQRYATRPRGSLQPAPALEMIHRQRQGER